MIEIRESAEKIISSKCEHLTKALTDTTDVSVSCGHGNNAIQLICRAEILFHIRPKVLRLCITLSFIQQSVEDYGAVNTFSWSRTELVVLPPNDSVGPPAEKKRKDLSSGLIQQNSDGKTLGM